MKRIRAVVRSFDGVSLDYRVQSRIPAVINSCVNVRKGQSSPCSEPLVLRCSEDISRYRGHTGDPRVPRHPAERAHVQAELTVFFV